MHYLRDKSSQHYSHKHPLNRDKLKTSLILIPVGRKPNKTKTTQASLRTHSVLFH